MRRAVGLTLVVLGVIAVVYGASGLLRSPRPEPEAIGGVPTAIVTPSPSPSSSPSPSPPERPADFFAAFQVAVRAGDSDWLLARLHPAVLQRYGAPACQEDLGSFSDPGFTVEVQQVDPPAPWTWESDGLSETIPDALTVTIARSDGGASPQTVATHLARVGEELRWFTDCGEPAEAAA